MAACKMLQKQAVATVFDLNAFVSRTLLWCAASAWFDLRGCRDPKTVHIVKRKLWEKRQECRNSTDSPKIIENLFDIFDPTARKPERTRSPTRAIRIQGPRRRKIKKNPMNINEICHQGDFRREATQSVKALLCSIAIILTLWGISKHIFQREQKKPQLISLVIFRHTFPTSCHIKPNANSKAQTIHSMRCDQVHLTKICQASQQTGPSPAAYLICVFYVSEEVGWEENAAEDVS